MEILYSFFLPMLVAIALYSVPIINSSIERTKIASVLRFSGATIAIISGFVSILIAYNNMDMSLLWCAVFLPSIFVGIYLVVLEVGLRYHSETVDDDLRRDKGTSDTFPTE